MPETKIPVDQKLAVAMENDRNMDRDGLTF